MDDNDNADFCICDHPTLCTCIFELDWMEELVTPIYDQGYDDGYADGLEDAIYDTIYREPKAPDPVLYDDEIPFEAFVDPHRYRRAYAQGYRMAYHTTYRRHRAVLEELEQIHSFQHIAIRLLLRFRTHPCLDPRLFPEMKKYVKNLGSNKFNSSIR